MSVKEKTSARAFRVLMLDTTGGFYNWVNNLGTAAANWQVNRLDNAASLLDLLKQSGCDAVILSCSTRAQSDLDLMQKVAGLQPKAIRVFIGGQFWSAEQRAKAGEIAHRVFPDQVNMHDLTSKLEYLCKVTRLLNRSSLHDYIGNLKCLPSPPGVYKELTDAIQSDVADAMAISRIIEGDPAVAAQVMRQVNSAYFGFQREISNLREAVTLLGLRNLRGLALSSHLNSQFKQSDDWKDFSFERQHERSLLVARLAQSISRKAGASKTTQDHAFLGGLLHDLGVLIFASHDPEHYRKVLRYSAKKQKPLHLVEKAVYGFFHGELGAALLAMWRLPEPVVEAVMLHHVPHLSADAGFTALTAVHAADALLPSVEVVGKCNMASDLSMRYLEQIGVESELPQWKMLANEYRLKMVANA
ncbi:HDOD domain-containing protein [Pontibacter sp. JAM-7]|uniref:HDOD domain-containing protein n=1 Tax=Pontibacter sp. JAM-7 TaxID=3366581 RepID=UPI003AF66B80